MRFFHTLFPSRYQKTTPDMAGITFSMIPVSLVLLAGGISIFVAVLSGWRPARKATKIEVIQALRQEL